MSCENRLPRAALAAAVLVALLAPATAGAVPVGWTPAHGLWAGLWEWVEEVWNRVGDRAGAGDAVRQEGPCAGGRGCEQDGWSIDPDG